MINLLRDLQFGCRMLLKNVGLTLIAVLTLGLGIGLTATMFSIVKGVVLSELPFERPDRILYLGSRNLERNESFTTVSPADYLDWKARQKSFEALAAFRQAPFNLSGDGRPERVNGAWVTPDAFGLLRVQPQRGRALAAGDDTPAAPAVVVIGAGLWRSRYGGDPQVVGRAIRVNGQPATVVGIMPADFLFPVHEEIWAPLRLDPNAVKRGEGQPLDVFGRLRDGASAEKAQAELAAIARGLGQEYPQTNAKVGATSGPYTKKYVNQDAATLLFAMLGVVGLVLLLACANVTSLIMARASVRTRELAIRSVLGAGRRGVFAQMLVESLILAVLGAALGLVLTGLGIEIFNASIADANPPFWFNTAIDVRSLLFVVAVSAFAGVVAGLLPALQASKVDVNQVLKDEGRGSTGLRIGRFSRGIVIFEVALSCALLVGAGLMIKSIVNIRNLDLGFDRRGLFTAALTLDATRYPQPADRLRFYDELLRGLGTRPGVSSAGLVDALPTEYARTDLYAVEGHGYGTDRDRPSAHRAAASAGLFSTLGCPLTAGRDFNSGDRTGTLPVVIVNRSFAARTWPNESPLGRRIRLGKGETGVWRTVVGVVPDLRMNGFDTSSRPDGVYLPIAQEAPAALKVVARTPGDPLALSPTVREAVAALDRDLPLDDVASLETVAAKNAFAYSLFGALFSVFGLAALLLASVGIYGVIAFSVQQRTREIGIRMALGAQRGEVMTLLLRQGARQLALGLAAGLLLAAGIAVLLGGTLFQVKGGDPAVYLGVVLVLSAVALLACFIPALRATRVDPQVAIRHE
jgi:putative ABC transport system permease protein